MQPIKVKDMVIHEVSFAARLAKINAPENAALKNSLGYIDYLDIGVDAKALLPTRSKFRVDFTISDTCSGFANGIRKCMMEEIPIYSLELGEIVTNDAYVISDVLQKNINLLPIIQDAYDLDDMKTWKFSLDVTNVTDRIMPVKSGSIKISAKGKDIPIETFVSPNITIAELRPTTNLKCKDFSIVVGMAQDDAAKFASVSNTRYLISGPVPDEQNPGSSSLVENPREFRLGYTTYRNVNDPKAIMRRVCEALNGRLVAFMYELKEVRDVAALMHFSNSLDIETRGDFKIFNFKNESWTLVNMISQYCYMLDPSIPFVAPSIVHPSTSVGVVKIKHANPLRIIADAITHIISDIDILRKAF
jgi:DNA-directed RNA polymerase subunit L